jgi:phospholipid/cholesterol/gamma-HCH transport system substrate-binding protein
LPIDSSAVITSSGVVGSRFVNISPGSGTKLISKGGKIEYTQAEANVGGIIDNILGMFTKQGSFPVIYSSSHNSLKEGNKDL